MCRRQPSELGRRAFLLRYCLRDEHRYASRNYDLSFWSPLGLFLVESAVYPHLRRYVCDSAVPESGRCLLLRSENGLQIPSQQQRKINNLAGRVSAFQNRQFLNRF